MTKTEQLAAAFAKLEEAGKLLRDAGEERLAEETDQLAIQATGYAIVVSSRKAPLGPFALPEARVLQILLQGFALARHTLLYLKRDITDSLELTCGCLCDPDVPSPEGKHLSVGQRLELSK